MNSKNEIRLQKFLAEAGIASRRKCEELIMQGKVTVNEKIVTELGTKIDPDTDKVTYNGQIVESGTHQELVGLNGKYKELMEKQINNDKDII